MSEIEPMAVVVCGVSGVGKSTIGSELATKLDARFLDADDLHTSGSRQKMAASIPLSDDERWPWLDAVGGQLQEAGSRGQAVVVACSALSRAHRTRLARCCPGVLFVQLWADSGEIDGRVRSRTHDFMASGLLDSQLRVFEPLGESEQGQMFDATQMIQPLVLAIQIWIERRFDDSRVQSHPETRGAI